MSPSPLRALPLLGALALCPAASAGEAPAPAAHARAGAGVPLSLSYLGKTAVHPGARLATELALVRGGGHLLLVEPALGASVHPGHSRTLFAEALAGYRFTFGFGLRAEALVGLAYTHRFVDGAVFRRAADGGVAQAADPGSPDALALATAGLGWDFGAAGGAPLALFVRPRFSWERTALGPPLARPSLEAGLTWTLPL
jgi:hypothetical protein